MRAEIARADRPAAASSSSSAAARAARCDCCSTRCERPAAYVADRHLARAAARRRPTTLAARFPASCRSSPVCADYMRPLDLPAAAGARAGRRLGFFPGSTIGNFTPDRGGRLPAPAAGACVGRRRRDAGRRRSARRTRRVLHAAYNDAQGVTAAFNLNLLERINRELGADFDLDRFAHDAFYNEADGPHRDLHPQPRRSDRDRRRPRHPLRRGRAHPHREFLQIHDRRLPPARRARRLPAGATWTDPQQLFSVHLLA